MAFRGTAREDAGRDFAGFEPASVNAELWPSKTSLQRSIQRVLPREERGTLNSKLPELQPIWVTRMSISGGVSFLWVRRPKGRGRDGLTRGAKAFLILIKYLHSSFVYNGR